MIRHFVLVRFRDDFGAAERAALMGDLEAAVTAIAGCSGFTALANQSIEAPMIKSFENAFIVDFEDEAARQRYLDDADHKSVGARIVAGAEGGTDGVIVFDYKMS